MYVCVCLCVCFGVEGGGGGVIHGQLGDEPMLLLSYRQEVASVTAHMSGGSKRC